MLLFQTFRLNNDVIRSLLGYLLDDALFFSAAILGFTGLPGRVSNRCLFLVHSLGVREAVECILITLFFLVRRPGVRRSTEHFKIVFILFTYSLGVRKIVGRVLNDDLSFRSRSWGSQDSEISQLLLFFCP